MQETLLHFYWEHFRTDSVAIKHVRIIGRVLIVQSAYIPYESPLEDIVGLMEKWIGIQLLGPDFCLLEALERMVDRSIENEALIEKAV